MTLERFLGLVLELNVLSHMNAELAQPRNRSNVNRPFSSQRVGSGDETISTRVYRYRVWERDYMYMYTIAVFQIKHTTELVFIVSLSLSVYTQLDVTYLTNTFLYSFPYVLFGLCSQVIVLDIATYTPFRQTTLN